MNTRKDLAPKLAAHQERLGAVQGKQYWRSLEELAETEAFQELVRDEFPEQASIWPDSLSRRALPDPDGSVPGPGRPERLLGPARTLRDHRAARAGAGGDPAGTAVVLLHGHDDQWLRGRSAGRKP